MSSTRPSENSYPASLTHVGDHIRKRRLDLGFFQRQAAEQIGVTTSTICNWEKHRSEPGIWEWVGVIRFLGYLPFELGDAPSEIVRAYRMIKGLSYRELAKLLGRDEETVRRWESRRSKIPKAFVVEARFVVGSFGHVKPPVS